MTLVKRRHRNSGRQNAGKRCPSHLKWIRGCECIINDAECTGRIEAAHVRTGTDGGASLKPSDKWTVPMCVHHHSVQHSVGEAEFERYHKIDLKKLAERYASASAHKDKLKKMEAE